VQRLIDSRWFWVLPAVAIGALLVQRPWLHLGISMSLANVAIAAVIFRCVSRPDGAIGRVLERPRLVWLGTLSYSLYLWQQLFLNRHSEALFAQFPQNLIAAFLAAMGCHYLIERPVLQLRAERRERAVRKPVIVNVPEFPGLAPALGGAPSVIELPQRRSDAPRSRPITGTSRPITDAPSAGDPPTGD
jgi:peptidoglycan/LPS O-acetylase OafA/YrhL